MLREKGIVLKTNRSRCVVLTPGGEFRTVPRPAAAAVGQEIEFAVRRPRARMFLAAASSLVLLVAGSLFTSLFPAAGYVSVDMKPSLELGMNAWGRVVRAEGLNADGRTMLRSLPLYGRPLGQALDSIVDRAQTLHYLKPNDPDNTVVITYTPGRLALVRLRKQTQAYQTLADRLKAEHVPAGLVFARMTRAQRRAARSQGLSPGKYLVENRFQARGVKISPQQMAGSSIAALLKVEKMRLDTVMGPGNGYWKVKMEGIPSVPQKSPSSISAGGPPGRTKAGSSSADQEQPSSAKTGRTAQTQRLDRVPEMVREKEQQLKEQQLKEQQLKEQQRKEQQRKEQQLKEQQLKEQQLKEEKLKEEKLKEQQLKEEKLKEQQEEQRKEQSKKKESEGKRPYLTPYGTPWPGQAGSAQSGKRSVTPSGPGAENQPNPWWPPWNYEDIF